MRTTLPAGLFLALVAGPSAAQPELLRLDLTEPQIVLTAGGRTGACDELTFTRDGNTLLAVGDDKVLHSWAVRGGELSYQPPVRWNVYRERRGALYALALSPDERFAAVGGFGRLFADVSILDRTTGQLSAGLSPGTNPAYQTGGTVWSLAFDPTGQRLAIGLQDGAVYVWTLATGQVSPVAPPVGGFVRWMSFTGDTVRFARADGGVSEAKLGEAPRELFRFPMAVAHVVGPPDGRWLAASPSRQTEAGSTVEVRGLPGGEKLHSLPFARERLPESLAAADGKLAVGCRLVTQDTRFSSRWSGELHVFDVSAPAARLAAYTKFDGDAAMVPQRLAFHPDGTTVAVAGGPDHATRLFKIDGQAITPAGRSAVGVGKGVFQVGTRADGTTVLFRQTPAAAPAHPNDRGTGDWRAFDLTRLGWAEPGEPTDAAVKELNGWKVEFDAKDEFRWRAVNGEFDYPLPIDPATADRPVCYTFLPSPTPRWTRLAVGFYWGFALFDLRGGFAPKPVGRGVGHHGLVTSIAPARGGKMLVTGSTDQTVCLWSLQPWDHHPLLGARFQWEFDRLTQQRVFVVGKVHAGSPAWEMGLIEGDRVAELGLAGTGWVKDSATWEDAIKKLEPDRELAMKVVRPGTDGTPIPVRTSLLTRPQARLFPTAGHDWVLYKYTDYYYASSTNGDAYLGWQLSGKTAADAPAFHPADRFKEVFYKPSMVRDAVVQAIREPNRPIVRDYLPPGVTVRASAAATVDEPVTVTIAARPRTDANDRPINLEKVELWLDDDVLIASWAALPPGPFNATKTVQASQMRVGKNRLTAVAYARTRAETSTVVTHTPKAVKPAVLRGVAVGVDKYPYLTAAGQLTAAASDAKLMGEALGGLAGTKSVRTSNVDLVLDAAATPDAILKKVEAAGKDLAPDDWLVVFMAGHGFADLDVPDAGPRRVKPGSWFFCGSAPDQVAVGGGAGGKGERQVFDFSTAATQRDVDALVGGLKKINATVAGTDLLTRLNALNCRKLVLLDACHAGAIEQDPGRDLRPNGKGAIVLTASAPDETASEFDIDLVRNGKQVSERHGFFTAAVYTALTTGTADRNGDGLLTLEELQQAVSAEVNAARKKAGLTKPQTVLACPADLRDVVFVGGK